MFRDQIVDGTGEICDFWVPNNPPLSRSFKQLCLASGVRHGLLTSINAQGKHRVNAQVALTMREWTDELLDQHYEALDLLRKRNPIGDTWCSLGRWLWKSIHVKDNTLGVASGDVIHYSDPREVRKQLWDFQTRVLMHPWVKAHIGENGEVYSIILNSEKEEYGPFPTQEEEQAFFEGYVYALLNQEELKYGPTTYRDADGVLLDGAPTEKTYAEADLGWAELNTETLARIRNNCCKFLCRNLADLRSAVVYSGRWSMVNSGRVEVTPEVKFHWSGQQFLSVTRKPGTIWNPEWYASSGERYSAGCVGVGGMRPLISRLTNGAREFAQPTFFFDNEEILMVGGEAKEGT